MRNLQSGLQIPVSQIRGGDVIWAWNGEAVSSEKQCRLPWFENQNVGYRFFSLEHCVVSAASLRGLSLLACNTHVEKWKWACVSSCEIHWNTFHVTLHRNMNNVQFVQLITQLHVATRLPFLGLLFKFNELLISVSCCNCNLSSKLTSSTLYYTE